MDHGAHRRVLGEHAAISLVGRGGAGVRPAIEMSAEDPPDTAFMDEEIDVLSLSKALHLFIEWPPLDAAGDEIGHDDVRAVDLAHRGV